MCVTYSVRYLSNWFENVCPLGLIIKLSMKHRAFRIICIVKISMQEHSVLWRWLDNITEQATSISIETKCEWRVKSETKYLSWMSLLLIGSTHMACWIHRKISTTCLHRFAMFLIIQLRSFIVRSKRIFALMESQLVQFCVDWHWITCFWELVWWSHFYWRC